MSAQRSKVRAILIELTKRPVSLSSIQCFGATSRLRCFFGPRAMVVTAENKIKEEKEERKGGSRLDMCMLRGRWMKDAVPTRCMLKLRKHQQRQKKISQRDFGQQGW